MYIYTNVSVRNISLVIKAGLCHSCNASKRYHDSCERLYWAAQISLAPLRAPSLELLLPPLAFPPVSLGGEAYIFPTSRHMCNCGCQRSHGIPPSLQPFMGRLHSFQPTRSSHSFTDGLGHVFHQLDLDRRG